MRIGIRRSIPLPGPFYVSTRRRRNRKSNPSGMLLLLVAWLPAILMGWESLAVYIPVALGLVLIPVALKRSARK